MLSVPHSPNLEQQTTTFNQGFLPLSVLKSGKLLYLSPRSRGGLIVQKEFYADFVGPGAVVGGSFDESSTSVYVVGKVEVQFLQPGKDRQQAFQQRMAYSEELSKIVRTVSPLHRAYRMLEQLSTWIGIDEAHKIPVELIARLAGVFPRTIVQVLQQRPNRVNQNAMYVNQDAMDTLIVMS
jgi:hypothetical protein